MGIVRATARPVKPGRPPGRSPRASWGHFTVDTPPPNRGAAEGSHPWDGSADELRPVPRDDPRAALIASERRARALFEGIEDSVFVHDLDGRILDANQAASRRLGYSREEFLTLTTRDIDDPGFAAGYDNRLVEQLARGSLHCEGRHRTKDGRVIPVDINTSTILLEDRPVVLAVIRDITERKALEGARAAMAAAQDEHARQIEEKNRELSRSEARYRMLTEASLDAVIVADPSARITLFNPSAERTFGYTSAEVLGRPLAMLLLEDGETGMGPGGFQEALRARDPGVVGRTLSMRGARKGGDRFPLEISVSTIETAEGVQFLGSIRDQTDRQRMTAVLAQSEKLASIGLLSAGVAHEINNPLAFVGNNLAVLDRDLSGLLALLDAYGEASTRAWSRATRTLFARILAAPRGARLGLRPVQPRADDLARTREGVGRVASIVQTMRGLARTAPPEMEPASLAALVASALELVQGRVRKGGIAVRREDHAGAAPPLGLRTRPRSARS